MFAIFNFEVKRVFLKRINVAIFLFFLISSMFLVNLGITEYLDFENSKQLFFDYEESKVNNYVTWDQYGGFGFGLLYQPSPLFVFLKDSYVFNDITSNIDIREIINVSIPCKGGSLFTRRNSLDLAGLLFIFGSLFMLYLGLTNFHSKKSIIFHYCGKKIYKSVLSRILLLDAFFAALFVLNFGFAGLRGIAFSQTDVNNFLLFAFYSLIFLNFFYFVGLAVATLFRTKRLMIILLIWFTAVFITPLINQINIKRQASEISQNEKINLGKLEVLMDVEQQIKKEILAAMKQNKSRDELKAIHREFALKYLNKGYVLNKNSEAEYTNEMRKLINRRMRVEVFLPFTFYPFLGQEISSKGYISYLNFLEFIEEIREGFVKFYMDNRYNKFGLKIEPYQKAEENIFKAQSRLPENYWVGLALTVFYSLVLLMVSLFVIRRRLGKVLVVEDRPDLEYLEGTSIYMMCKDEEYRDNVFEIFVRQENVAGLDRVEVKDIDSGVHPRKAVHCLAAIRGVNERTVLDHLRIMGVEEEGLNTSKPSVELLKKIYAALVMAEADIIVINDFLKGETRAFEKDFLNLVAELKKQGKMFVYMSTEIFSATAAAEERYYSVVEVYNYKAVDIENTSLR